METGLLHLVAISLVYCMLTVHYTNAAPWIPTIVEPGPSTTQPDPSVAADSTSSNSDTSSGLGFLLDTGSFPSPNANTGQNLPPGQVIDSNEQNFNVDQRQASDANATSVSNQSQLEATFDFSASEGNTGTDGQAAPIIDNPWLPDPSAQNETWESGIPKDVLEDLIKKKCTDLCDQIGDICTGTGGCVVTDNCTAICNKADGTQVVFNPKDLRPVEERHCRITDKLCVHGSCPDDEGCVCDEGYEGDLCASSGQCLLPCGNGGTCQRVSEDHYDCACAPGWQGVLCLEPVCTLACARGSCRYRPGEEPRESAMYCNCPSGWTGELCDERIPDPAALSKKLALAVGIATPVVCLLALAISWYILWRMRVIFVFKIINMFKAYEDDDDKLYDAYVSLTERDYGFVKQVLQPKLDEMGHRLYIQARDGAAGSVKSEMILEAVEKSRRCIMLLSADYISNEWCRFEYLIAQHETCIKLKQRIIPILIDDIDKDRKKMDKSLQFIVNSVKCLRYPKPPLEQEKTLNSTTSLKSRSRVAKEEAKYESRQNKFWERLRLSMPKKRDSQKEKKSPSPPEKSNPSSPSYRNKTKGLRSLFSKLSKSLRVGGQGEKASATDLSLVKPKSSSENPVILMNVSGLLDPNVESFQSDNLERGLNGGDCFKSSVVVVDDDDGENTKAVAKV